MKNDVSLQFTAIRGRFTTEEATDTVEFWNRVRSFTDTGPKPYEKLGALMLICALSARRAHPLNECLTKIRLRYRLENSTLQSLMHTKQHVKKDNKGGAATWVGNALSVHPARQRMALLC